MSTKIDRQERVRMSKLTRPSKLWIRPAKVDIGRGEEPRVVQYRGRDPLPAAGAGVTTEGDEGAFWHRRLNDGDVEVIPEPPPTKPRAVRESKES